MTPYIRAFHGPGRVDSVVIVLHMAILGQQLQSQRCSRASPGARRLFSYSLQASYVGVEAPEFCLQLLDCRLTKQICLQSWSNGTQQASTAILRGMDASHIMIVLGVAQLPQMIVA